MYATALVCSSTSGESGLNQKKIYKMFDENILKINETSDFAYETIEAFSLKNELL